MPMDSNESNNQSISPCCFSVSPPASADGQSILATVAIQAPLNAICAFKGRIQSTEYRVQTNMALYNRAILYMENFGGVGGFEDLGKVLPIGVGNENLAKIVALY